MRVMVSILVLLDVCKEPCSFYLVGSGCHEFQSLFYWMYVKNVRSKENWGKKSEVSILVLLDVCKEHLFEKYGGTIFFVSILVLLDVCKELEIEYLFKLVFESFNPCFIGCM